MNILLVTDSEANPLSGGIEHVTYNLSESFKKLSHHVCCVTADADFDDLLKKNHFDIILSKILKKYNTKQVLPKIYKLTRNTNTVLIACFHNLPTYELYGRKTIIRLMRKTGFTFLLKRHIIKKLKYFLNSDYILFESPRYIPLYKQLVDDQTHAYIAIPNTLGFKEWLEPHDLSAKPNDILMMVRFDESQKRVTLALKIWKEIERCGLFNDWTLRIVGYGPDEKLIFNCAKKLRLNQVVFEGRQKPESYFRNAAIYMMTSAYEGFPMALGEAHQSGAVPIAFDSFPAVHDIIENDYNGILIKNNDIKTYAEQLKALMQNKEKREKMAKNGLISSKRFSEDEIMKQWEVVFKQIVQPI